MLRVFLTALRGADECSECGGTRRQAANLDGWAAQAAAARDSLNVVIGVVGALIGGWLISPLVGVATINQADFSIPGLAVSLLGAVILLAVVNLIRSGRTR